MKRTHARITQYTDTTINIDTTTTPYRTTPKQQQHTRCKIVIQHSMYLAEDIPYALWIVARQQRDKQELIPGSGGDGGKRMVAKGREHERSGEI